MCRILLTALASLIVPAGLFAQTAVAPGPSDAFQVRYAANLGLGDSVVDIINAGSTGSTICAHVYAFDAGEEPIACCSCALTPNQLGSFSVTANILSNTVTGVRPPSVVIKLLAAAPNFAGCSAATPGTLVAGMRAWGTTLHRTPTGGTALTETEFLNAPLSGTELASLEFGCAAIGYVGSGHGICGGCPSSGLAVTK